MVMEEAVRTKQQTFSKLARQNLMAGMRDEGCEAVAVDGDARNVEAKLRLGGLLIAVQSRPVDDDGAVRLVETFSGSEGPAWA
jgi:hypothetical protein